MYHLKSIYWYQIAVHLGWYFPTREWFVLSYAAHMTIYNENCVSWGVWHISLPSDLMSSKFRLCRKIYCTNCPLSSFHDPCLIELTVICLVTVGRISHKSKIVLLQWRHNGHNSVSNHQPHDCLLNHLFRRRWKKTSKFHVTGLCTGNSPVTGEFPAQMAINAENVSIWWRHHGDKYMSPT